MSFGKVMTLSMLAAFSAGAGYSYVADKPPLTASLTDKFDGSSSMSRLLKPTPATAKPVSIRPYALCSGSVRVHCVVDGDTLWHDSTKIRIADIDTPEVGSPKCASEAALGAKATQRMLQLVNAAPFEMQSWNGRDEDQYGRKLRVLVRNGQSLGDVLVSEGLARTWTGRREPWC